MQSVVFVVLSSFIVCICANFLFHIGMMNIFVGSLYVAITSVHVHSIVVFSVRYVFCSSSFVVFSTIIIVITIAVAMFVWYEDMICIP
jgi:hypothetical protein